MEKLCNSCKKPSLKYLCEDCNIKKNQTRVKKYNEWKSSGLCVQCGRETLTGSNYCEQCYLQIISRTHFGTVTKWKDLKKIMANQNYKCALTDITISFNDDVELDHVIPISRGGSNNISNFRWVIKKANRLKSNLTDPELLDIITKISKVLKKRILCNKLT